jgi:hypothetical protein
MFTLFFLVLEDAATLRVEGELWTADLIVLELSHRLDFELLARLIQLSHIIFSVGLVR